MTKISKEIKIILFIIFFVLGIGFCLQKSTAGYVMITIPNVDNSKPWQAGTSHMVKITAEDSSSISLCLYKWSDKKCVYNFPASVRFDAIISTWGASFWNAEDSVYLTIPSDTVPGNDYQISAINYNNVSLGGSNYFTVTSNLQTPSLISPANKSTTTSINPALEWQKAPGVGVYIVYSSLDPKVTTKNKANLFDNNQTYNWQVKACADTTYKNCTDWSEQRSFAINPSSSPVNQALTIAELQRIFTTYGKAIAVGGGSPSGVGTWFTYGGMDFQQQTIILQGLSSIGADPKWVADQKATIDYYSSQKENKSSGGTASGSLSPTLQNLSNAGANPQWLAEQAAGGFTPAGAAYCSSRGVNITMPNVDSNKPWQAGISHMVSVDYMNDGPSSLFLCTKNNNKCIYTFPEALRWDNNDGAMCGGGNDSIFLTIPSNTVPGNDYMICADSSPMYDFNNWKMNRCSQPFAIISNLKTPTLISPADKLTITTSNPSLEWSEVKGAGAYVVYATLDYKVLAENKTTLFNNNQIYSWQVRACADTTYKNCTDWSEQRSFTIKK